MFSVLLGVTITALSAKRCVEEYNKYKTTVCTNAKGDTFIYYFYDKKLHNTKGPAFQRINKHNVVELSKYYIKGKLHRVGKPAVIHKSSNGNTKTIKFYENDELHHVNGPAEIYYTTFERTRVYKMYWYQRGKLYNPYGPTIVHNVKNSCDYHYDVDL